MDYGKPSALIGIALIIIFISILLCRTFDWGNDHQRINSGIYGCFYEKIIWPNNVNVDEHTNIYNAASNESFQKIHNDVDIQ